MKTRAAVGRCRRQAAGKSWKFDLEGPREGEVLVENQGDRHLPHRRVHPVGGPTRKASSRQSSAMRAPEIVVDVGAGVTSLKKGDHVIPPLHARMPFLPVPCLSRKTNLCTAIRATQGQGLMPDGTSRFSIGKDKIFHYMGCSTFANSHGSAGDRACQGQSRRALRQDLLHRLRRDHRHRRGDQHRQGGDRRDGAAVFGLGGIGF